MQTGMVKAGVSTDPRPLELTIDFTKQYNRQKVILQHTEAGIPPQQGPKRNPQTSAPASIAPAAYTSRKAGEYDDSIDALSRYAGRINLKDDGSRWLFVLVALNFM